MLAITDLFAYLFDLFYLPQGNQHYGTTKTGYLSKKSDGKMRRVWQKRRCEVADGGFLSIYHSDESKPPTRLNLLTCQLKLPYQNQGDERQRCFDLVSCE